MPVRMRDVLARLVMRWGGVAADPERLFIGDGLVSRHNHDFTTDPGFRAAYARGVEAAGWDYGFPWRVHTGLWAARTAARIPGDFVELGTGRGVMASCIMRALDWSSLDRTFWLFDTFSPHAISAATGVQDDSQPSNAYYALDADTTARNFQEWPRVQLVPGLVPDSLDRLDATTIAFAHIDLNSPQPEVDGLRLLWPRLSAGALVLLDDYAYFGHRAQLTAMNQLGRELGFEVLALPTGQGLVVRR